MVKHIDLNLDSIKTQEAFIINKTSIEGKDFKLILSRKCTPLDNEPNKYVGYFSAEMRLSDEIDNDMLDTSFLVKVVLSAIFTSNDTSSEFTQDELKENIIIQMFPYVRATFASIMSSAGITPYFIPNSGIVN